MEGLIPCLLTLMQEYKHNEDLQELMEPIQKS